MALIVIRLLPAKLANPDLDLRYLIPDQLAVRSGGLLRDNGYDYELPGDAMQIYLLTLDLEAALPHVIELLEEENGLMGNRLADGAEVGINESNEFEVAWFVKVYPAGEGGTIEVPEY